MKRLMRSKFLIISMICIFIVYIIPFILMYLPDPDKKKSIHNYHYKYSYGPTGLIYEKTLFMGGTKRSTLLLYCGISTNPALHNHFLKLLSHLHVYSITFILFVVHLFFLIYNHRKISQIKNYGYFNSKQIFIIQSGTLSTVIFILQIINFAKAVYP